MMISSFLFDFDGTLFDTSAANVAAYSQAFRDIGLVFDAEIYTSSFGLRFEEMIRLVAPQATIAQQAQIRDLKAKHYKKNFHLVRPNIGLLELLKGIQGKFTTALVTTARHENVMSLLDHFSIEASLFNVIVSAGDVTHAKPDPECYMLAMEKLHVAPEACCVFEDSEVGFQAAERAGAHVIRVLL